MDYKIQLSTSHFTGEEQKYITAAFQNNTVSSYGTNINKFESELCNYTGINGCAVLSSGTAAIHLALILLGVKENDEIICSSFTFSATVNPIRYQKAIPIFVDSERETLNMCPELLEKTVLDRIKKGKKPKAILLVHLYGMPSKMEEILEIATKYRIPILEDAAEAIGARYNGKPMGTFGEIGIFSFNGNKIITTSGGGALISNNLVYCKKAIFLATQARDDAPHYQHSEIGYNYRMTNIEASIGLGQLEVLDERVKERRRVFEFYKKGLSGMDEISFIDEPKNFYSNRWLTTILTDSFETREDIRMSLYNKGIESRPLWKPMHLQPIFETYPAYKNGVSEDFFNRGLCLPSGSNLSNKQIDEVISIIKKVI